MGELDWLRQGRFRPGLSLGSGIGRTNRDLTRGRWFSPMSPAPQLRRHRESSADIARALQRFVAA